MLPIRPALAQRATVFGSTRKVAATSPEVRKRSGVVGWSLMAQTLQKVRCAKHAGHLTCFSAGDGRDSRDAVAVLRGEQDLVVDHLNDSGQAASQLEGCVIGRLGIDIDHLISHALSMTQRHTCVT